MLSRGSLVKGFRKDNTYWISFNRIGTESCKVPTWLGQFFSVLPIRAATAGNEQGYLVLEWPQNFSLQSLKVPCTKLQQQTGRALIVTAKVSEEKALLSEDICYRYFAPQYSTVEDTATGSAMRVLTDYWYQRAAYQSLTAYQCSKEGGLLFSRLKESFVLVGGSVENEQRI